VAQVETSASQLDYRPNPVMATKILPAERLSALPWARLYSQGVRAAVAHAGGLANIGWSQFPRLRNGRDWRELIDGEGALPRRHSGYAVAALYTLR
jgi:hypothetical protein